MIEFYKKYWRTAFDIGLIILTVYLIMWLFSWLYSIAAPILLALVIFAIIEPLARFLHRRGFSKLIATSISILFYSAILIALLAGIGYLFVAQTTGLMNKLPEYAAIFQTNLEKIMNMIQNEWDALPDDVTEKIQQYASTVVEYGATLAQAALKGLINSIGSFSSFIVDFAIAIILAFFLSLEAKTWKRVAQEKTPKTFKRAFSFLRDNVLKGIAKYIKALLLLISISSGIIFISLMILGVDNALSVSLIAAIFDILPLLGVAALFIPWIIYMLIAGNTTLAIWLVVILLVVMITRQILEPRIMGNSLGVSAFTMLALMVLSTSIFGIAGLILSPIITVLIKALYDQGYLQSWIRWPEDEFREDEESRENDTSPPENGQNDDQKAEQIPEITDGSESILPSLGNKK